MTKYRFALPPGNLTHAFDVQVAPLIEKIQANILEARTLAETRNNLLPNLISGEVRLPEEMVAEFAEA